MPLRVRFLGGGDDVEPVTRSRGGVSFPAMTHRNPFATKIEMSPSRFLKLDPSSAHSSSVSAHPPGARHPKPRQFPPSTSPPRFPRQIWPTGLTRRSSRYRRFQRRTIAAVSTVTELLELRNKELRVRAQELRLAERESGYQHEYALKALEAHLEDREKDPRSAAEQPVRRQDVAGPLRCPDVFYIRVRPPPRKRRVRARSVQGLALRAFRAARSYAGRKARLSRLPKTSPNARSGIAHNPLAHSGRSAIPPFNALSTTSRIRSRSFGKRPPSGR